MLQVAVT